MRFLADENFPAPSVRILRRAGHDVAHVLEDSPGADDPDVMRRAGREGRILLTLDRDYHRMVYAERKAPPPAGLVYLRIIPQSGRVPGERMLDLLSGNLDLGGRFTTVTRDRVAQDAFPGS